MAAKKSMGKSEPKAPKETPKKATSKPKKQMEDDELEIEDDDDVTEGVKSSSKKSVKPVAKKGRGDDDDEDNDSEEEEVDDWEKPEEEDSWDPDFEEFDLPKSNAKKSGTAGKKAGKGDDEDLGIDDEFKDMDLFNDSGIDDDEDDY